MNQLIPKQILFGIFFFLMLLCVSCKKDKKTPEEPQATGSLTAAKTAVKQMEFVILTPVDINLNNSTYQANIGGIDITLGKDLNGNLCFTMPELANGVHQLSVKIEDQDYALSFNVEAIKDISNPDLKIQNMLNSFTVSSILISSLGSDADKIMGSGSSSANFNLLQLYHNRLTDSLKTASPQEKMQLAKFIEANPDFFQPFEDLMQYRDSLLAGKPSLKTFAEDQLIAFEIEVKKRLLKSVVFVSLLSMTGYATFTIPVFGPLISLACFYGAAKYATEIAHFACIYLSKKLIPEYMNMFTDVFQRGSVFNFDHNAQYTFSISANYRNLGQKDINSGSPLIKSLISSLNDFETIWNKINAIIPNKLSGNTPHLKNITQYSSIKWAVKPVYLSITSINNSLVTFDVKNEGNELRATFKNLSDTIQNFNFDLKYNNSSNDINITTALQGAITSTLSPPTTTVADIDGNVYNVVKIGTQYWTAENLKTTKFNNGDAITNASGSSQWSVATQAAWCYYNNNVQNNSPYGKLYNFFTVSDTRNVCPAGWHIPSDNEWTQLETFLGGAPIAGGKIKITGTQFWLAPNTSASNDFGFSAVPSGARNFGGNFSGMGTDGGWWSSSPNGSNNAWSRTPWYTDGNLYKNSESQNSGLALRCVKN